MRRCEECDDPHYAKGLCFIHYRRQWRNGDLVLRLRRNEGLKCMFAGCNKPAKAKEMCNMHYLRIWRNGEPGPAEELNKHDGTGRSDYLTTTINGQSYSRHSVIVEQALGKELPKGAEIHHLNGDGKDNRPCNLVVCPDRKYHKLIEKRQREMNYTGPTRINPPTKSQQFWNNFIK